MSPMPQPNGQNNEHLMVWNKQGSGIEKRYSCVNWHAKKITNTAKVYISFFKKNIKISIKRVIHKFEKNHKINKT